MAWIRLDDQIAHHPKFLKAGPIASWLFVGCIGYAQKFLTDGFIPKDAVSTLCGIDRPHQSVRRLVAVGLLEEVANGYSIHDYLEYNSSASEVQADRKWDRFRKELYSNPQLVKAIKQRDSNRCRYCGIDVNWSDRRGPSGGQFDHVSPRGPNTLENIVVACRRCNCKKSARTPEAAKMTLLASSELDKNQNGPSSELDLRARASYPSHPIPSHPNDLSTDNKPSRKRKAVPSAPLHADESELQKNLRLITKIAHEVLNANGHHANADAVEAIKELCAKRHIAYSTLVVRKALDSAEAQSA